MSQVLKKEDLYIMRPVAAPDIVRSNIFAWSVDKYNALENVTPSKELDARGHIADPMTKLWAADAMRAAKTAEEVAKIVSDYQMPREAVERANTIWLKSPIVWEALLPNMPGNALVRNLRNMAEIGLLEPMSDAEKLVVDRLMNPKYMGRVHPMQVLQAAVTYDSRVFKNSYAGNEKRSRKTGETKSYDVSQPVVNALNVALHNSYKNVTATGQRIMMAVDISGSMYWNMLDNFFPFFPAEAAGMMALIFAHIETRYMPMVFSNTLEPMKLSNTSSIDDVLKELREHSGASTDIGLPVKYALEKNIPIDTFISITDNEVNTGYHPATWMKKYRSKMNLPESKFITIAMQANGITVADPKDPYMLDVEGCSADTQDMVINYIRGEF
jgi:60 kDa SS-A/Ro ribonucleoprotein